MRTLLAIVVALTAFGALGCGDDGKPGGAPENSAIQRDPANAGKRITVGSKNFTEQYVLGELYAQALQAAGFDVRKRLDLGDEKVAFRALRRGRIDAYPEYTGTALTAFYRVPTQDVPRDKDRSFAQLAEDLTADGITALPQTPFQNTFVLTSTKDTAEDLGNPDTISDLVGKAGSGRSLSAFPECRPRPDCFLGLKTTYGWSPRFVSSEGKFEDLDQGQADFTFGFGTDGELTLDKYVTYDDDKQLFPPYYVTLLVRDDAATRLGDSGRKVVEAVQRPLTEQVMQELNSRVSLDKQLPEAVARDYLREQGFVRGGS
ncbi:MAG TPA: glycine betaine ABC transporter substrate-binding protein [Solirubrobacteraceae bacterium]|jgi:glycine betaine/choline ABC-type transport system substrate-binding protein